MYTAFTVMGDVYAKIFWVADERISGNGGVARHGALCEARHAMPVMRSMSGRVWSGAPTPPPRNATGGGVARTRRGGNATRVALTQRFTRCAAQHQ